MHLRLLGAVEAGPAAAAAAVAVDDRPIASPAAGPAGPSLPPPLLFCSPLLVSHVLAYSYSSHNAILSIAFHIHKLYTLSHRSLANSLNTNIKKTGKQAYWFHPLSVTTLIK